MISILITSLLLSADPATSVVSEDGTTIDTRDAASATDEGFEMLRKGLLREAESSFAAAIADDPEDPAALWGLGYTVYLLSDRLRPFHPRKQDAADLFARAYRLAPGFRPPLGTAGEPEE